MPTSENIREHIVPDGTSVIRELEFAGRESIERIVIPDSVREIGNYAFMNCYSLAEIRMPDEVDHIGSGLFQHCWKLRELAMPEGVRMIGGEMFEGCHALSVLTLPRTLGKVSRSAFSGCRSLREIIIDPEQLDVLPPAARYSAVLTYMEKTVSYAGSGNTELSAGVCSEGAGRHNEIIDDFVRQRQANLLDLAINRRSADAVRYMLERKLISPDVMSEFLSKSAARSRVEITALLLEYGHRGNGEGEKINGRGLFELDPFV